MHLPQAFSSNLSSVPDSTSCLKLNTIPFSRFFLNHWCLSVSPCTFYFPLTFWGKNNKKKPLELLSHLILAGHVSDRTENKVHDRCTMPRQNLALGEMRIWGMGSTPTRGIPQHCDKPRQRAGAECTLQNSTARLGPASTAPSPCHPKSRNSQRWDSSTCGQEESGPWEFGCC